MSAGVDDPERTGQVPPGSLAGMFRSMGYEVLPFKSTEEKVLAHVPRDIHLSVTASPGHDLERTVDLAATLSRAGYDVAPHLAARMVKGPGHLDDLLGRLHDGGVTSAFVIGGDGAEHQGYPDALALLTAIEEHGSTLRNLGIGGYPEGHAAIPQAALDQAVVDKARHASYVTTQMCFDARRTIAYTDHLAALGVDLPVRVGIPGAVSRQKLVRISATLGLGASARFLAKQQNLLWRFLLPGGYSPDRLVRGLRSAIERDGGRISGFHVFTFNEVEKTERWRLAMLDRLVRS